MLKELIKIANDLDQAGEQDLASTLDTIINDNKELIQKIAVRVLAWEAMSHEEHTPYEESEEGLRELKRDEYRRGSAERLAKIIADGSPIFGVNPETGEREEELLEKELAEVLNNDSHLPTIEAILEIID